MSGIGDIIDAVVGVADFATSFSDDYGYRGYGNPYNAPGFSEEDKKHVLLLCLKHTKLCKGSAVTRAATTSICTGS